MSSKLKEPQLVLFKQATEDWEFEAIHRLNYRTFVEEIPQHTSNREQRLVDRFHFENTYFICLRGKQLVGMIAVHSTRPFSLDYKLENLDSYLPPKRSFCEVRLLAVEKEYRNGFVFRGLASQLLRYVKEHDIDLALISATTHQEKLYTHLGFVPFGPLVGTDDALFQPMYITWEIFERQADTFEQIPDTTPSWIANFLPGPVAVSEGVQKAFNAAPLSHRSEVFARMFRGLKNKLCRLTGAKHVEIMLGSGTLANDVIAGQLRELNTPGLVLSNGEFGERLVDHAERAGLKFDVHRVNWGEPFDSDALQKVLAQKLDLGWLWAVHCETSTGVLNDLAVIKTMSAQNGLKLCLDCISSIGTTAVDLQGVYLASCVGSKGLGALPGLCMTFYNHQIKSTHNLPRYLDLAYYAANGGIPFTHSSNLLKALQATLREHSWPERFVETAEDSRWLRAALREAGYKILAAEEVSAPAVVTIVLPQDLSSKQIGDQLAEDGYLLSYGSEYLLERNWIQICLMGTYTRESLEGLIERLSELCLFVPQNTTADLGRVVNL
jgi:aspartate aminotransferase-like enzyme